MFKRIFIFNILLFTSFISACKQDRNQCVYEGLKYECGVLVLSVAKEYVESAELADFSKVNSGYLRAVDPELGRVIIEFDKNIEPSLLKSHIQTLNSLKGVKRVHYLPVSQPD
ncbi:hypothetical protein BIZ38_17660 [Pseudoalteromonas sp. BZK2]|uniref:hypothetical protein n=1 Tax=unclassified Pseudoalteromonas TaxID=194690 RepID=UPI00110B7673|nr:MULTISPECIES: hypothetical protein [unclassified Pseudoalteromonas]MBC7010275.1 hypothetical protein [Pseudoalteromonas sp. BZK2]TMP19966.1 hypothetical protein CWC02_07405 [Pseudoalteromonas sp. S2721]